MSKTVVSEWVHEVSQLLSHHKHPPEGASVAILSVSGDNVAVSWFGPVARPPADDTRPYAINSKIANDMVDRMAKEVNGVDMACIPSGQYALNTY